MASILLLLNVLSVLVVSCLMLAFSCLVGSGFSPLSVFSQLLRVLGVLVIYLSGVGILDYSCLWFVAYVASQPLLLLLIWSTTLYLPTRPVHHTGQEEIGFNSIYAFGE